MQYREIIPGNLLRQYIKCYYTYESDSETAFEDTVFPNGCMEVIFNLGAGNWQTAVGDDFVTTPPVELWGQIVKPLPVKSMGRNTMLGVRFYPHAATCFMNEEVGQFNNQVVNFRDVRGRSVSDL